jgi:hypothetical protein
MRGDDWGQYGDDEQVKELEAFLTGYTPLRKVDSLNFSSN